MADVSQGNTPVPGSNEAPSAGYATAVTAAEWPFVGRDHEMRQLGELLADDGAGGVGGVVLAGPPGVGKTRLGLECLQLAERTGLTTLRITATRAAAALPLGALSPLLPGDGQRPSAAGDSAGLLRRTAAALVEQAGDGRLVLFVDDAHLLDDVSATLVQQLAATGAVFVLVTVPTGVPAPDPMVALWRDGMAERIELQRLPEQAISELLSFAVRGPLDPAAVTELTGRAQGNVLFLRELVAGALRDRSLVHEHGLWRLRGSLSPSNRLVELVEARFECHGLAERALCELVSFGEPLGQAELTTLVDASVAEALERQGVLSSRMNGRRLEVGFAHPIFGDVVRQRIPAIRARAITRALAEAVEASGARRKDDLLRVASWRLIGGGGTPETMLAGAQAARWRYDFPLAERLARAALDAGAGFDAGLLAAELAGLQGRTEQAESELAALAVQALHEGDDPQRARVAVARMDLVTWIRPGDLSILDAAEATIDDPYWRDILTARRFPALLHAWGPRAVVEAAAPFLARAQGAALAHASIAAATGLARRGRLDEALDTSARGHAAQIAASESQAWYPWWHAANRCGTLNYAGRFEEAEAEAETHYRQAVVEGSIEAQAIFALVPTFAVTERGRLGAATRGAATALALARQLGRPLTVHLCYAYQARTLALSGRTQDASDALTAARDVLSRPGMRHTEVDVLYTRGWIAAAAGDLHDARGHFERAAQLGDEIGDLIGEARARHGLARVGRARDVLQRLATVTDQVDGVLAPAWLRHAGALAHKDAVELEAVSHDFEAMGADLLAAEAAADASVARRNAGELREATADARRASILAERSEYPVTPALRGIKARARLTDAERETALLAAAGRTNKQIAAALFLSARTVENRLHRVYQKLGISGRAELAGALGISPE